MKLGCSGRLFLIIVAVLVALAILGLGIGAIGAKLLGLSNPFAALPETHLPPEAIFHIGFVPVTNTMIAGWIATIIAVVLFWAATRRMKLVPRGLQNLMEMAVETLLNFVQGVVGRDKGRRFFPVIATIFLFVIFNAWIGLIPGFGSVVIKEVHDGEEVLVPLLRPANTDLNVPLALAFVSFVFVEYMGLTYIGARHYLAKFINVRPLLAGFKQLFTGKLKSGSGQIFMGGITFFVGIVETLGEFIRIISFTFRLFGNMTAGEILLLLMFFLVPFTVPVVFYSLELLVGFIQALIFGGLTLAFVAVATTEEGH